MRRSDLRTLRRLARLYGVQPSYTSQEGRQIAAAPESLYAVLRALGAPLVTSADLPDAVRSREIERWSWQLDAVIVAWEGVLPRVTLRLPRAEMRGRVECRLQVHDEETRVWSAELADLPVVGTVDIGGQTYVSLALPAAGRVRAGYHDLSVEAPGHRLEARVIAAPRRSYAPNASKQWGVFLPLYALHSSRSWGVGDLTDLAGFVDWASQAGAAYVGTVPLLSLFLDQPFDPSPYAPVSRIFWNELYIDPTLAYSKEMPASGLPAQAKRLNEAPLVPYREAMALKREVLVAQAKAFFAEGHGQQAYRDFLEAKPSVLDYARFRAALERLGPDWRHWPDAARDGVLAPGDYDEEVAGYYGFAQWRIDSQMLSLTKTAAQKGTGLYIDLPVGVHGGGYDAWRRRDLFAEGVSVGAPPDVVTTSGQDWGFQPLRPEMLQRSSYAYVVDYLRHHLQSAAMLRIDHAMGLHRLYCIPAGATAHDGVYVRYPADDMYAILSLESHRNQTVIAGENLGIVPGPVTKALTRHGIETMYVLAIELRDDGRQPFAPTPPGTIASFGTHDLPPFAAFWQGADFDDRLRLGVLSPDRAVIERKERESFKTALVAYFQKRGLLDAAFELEDVYRACVTVLAEGASRRVLLNLEDTWLETKSQNLPGTTIDQFPDWQHRARYSLEELNAIPALGKVIEVMRRFRPGGGEPDE